MRSIIIAGLLLWSSPLALFAQDYAYTHPELEWYTMSTVHYDVHYHEGAERSARVVAKVAEEIFEPVTSFYQWRPDGKIHFIIKDHDDNSNGAAYYYDNKVEIWAPQMTFILRGTHNWLRNVVTHEFCHMVQLGATRKLARRFPAFYLQLIGYEDEKRPDVLYGYPNKLASYPVPMTVIPMWFAEGAAQFQVPGLDYDRWDSHRDMLIRTAVRKGELFSYDEMGVFGKNSLGNERTYNAGYAFVRYIAHHYGAGILKDISRSMKQLFRFSIDGAFKKTTGFNGRELYDRWSSNLESYYAEKLRTIEKHGVEGTVLTARGIGNTYPVWSPDGKRIAFCGGKTADYLTRTGLSVVDISTGERKMLKAGINSALSWSGDGKKLLYSRRRRYKHGSHFYDLHFYDLESKKEHRITKKLRALDPDLSPDGDRIVCIVQKDGTDNLLLLDGSGGNLQSLTHFNDGEALYSPRWSPDGRTIVYAMGRRHGRDLFLMDPQTGESHTLLSGDGDARDPVFGPDGELIYFSWDRTGIFNIYSVRPDGGDLKQWTNVTGGAFMPHLSVHGKLIYSLFQYDGYKIALIDSPIELDPDHAQYSGLEVKTDVPELTPVIASREDHHLTGMREYDDSRIPSMEAKPYGMTYGQLTLLPRIMVDSSRVKIGTYFYASDILDRYSLIGGAAVNGRRDVDVFSIFNYRRLGPDLFLELYGLTRNVERKIAVIEDYARVNVGIHFNILEADLGAEIHPWDNQTVRFAFAHHRYTSQIKDFFFQDIKWSSPSNTYFIGNHFGVRWRFDGLVPRVDSQVNPSSGRRLELGLTREINQFFEDFATDNDYGTPQEVYSAYNCTRLELNWREYLSMPWSGKHALTAQLRAGWVDRPVDSFFYFFAGGWPGLRGYPYYSIEGRKLLLTRLTYRFPLFSHWQKRLFAVTTNRLYLGLYFDMGDAFNRDAVDFSAFKKDAGVNLRFSAFSFYGYPTAFSVDACYGLTRFEDEGVRYGREWRYYFSLLFDFLD